MTVRQKETKLSLTITGIRSVRSAIEILKDIQDKILSKES
jgi:hypothetical protein